MNARWGMTKTAPSGPLAVALCRAILEAFGDRLSDEDGHIYSLGLMTWDQVIERARQVVEIADKEERRG